MNDVAQTTGDSADTKRDSQPGSRLFLGSFSSGIVSAGIRGLLGERLPAAFYWRTFTD
jgi:hypothetical protein